MLSAPRLSNEFNRSIHWRGWSAGRATTLCDPWKRESCFLHFTHFKLVFVQYLVKSLRPRERKQLHMPYTCWALTLGFIERNLGQYGNPCPGSNLQTRHFPPGWIFCSQLSAIVGINCGILPRFSSWFLTVHLACVSRTAVTIAGRHNFYLALCI